MREHGLVHVLRHVQARHRQERQVENAHERRLAGRVGVAGLRRLEGADAQAVQVLLHRRDRLAEMDLDREVAVALLLDILRHRLDAAGIGARRRWAATRHAMAHARSSVAGAAPGIPATNPSDRWPPTIRSEEHTSELQSLMSISYAVFCLKKK